MSDFFRETGAERLLGLADVLDAAYERQQRYAQSTWFFSGPEEGKSCGTPACALGHHAAANPDRWEAVEVSGNPHRWFPRLKDGPNTDEVYPHARKEFGISTHEADTLFSATGCGYAKNGKEAAAFIRNFVYEKLKCEV